MATLDLLTSAIEICEVVSEVENSGVYDAMNKGIRLDTEVEDLVL